MFTLLHDDPDERCGPGWIGEYASIDEATDAACDREGVPDLDWYLVHYDQDSDLRVYRTTSLEANGRAYVIEEGKTNVTTDISEKERLDLQLSLGMDDDGSALSDTRRKEIEERLAAIDSQDEFERAKEGDESVPSRAYESAAPQGQQDIQAMIQAEIAKAMGGTPVGQPVNMSFEQILDQIDPRDSDAALAMLTWLEKNGRLQNIGAIHGGGYLWHYQEPKGSTKAGYTPGASKGGRMVDQAVAQAQAAGATPRQVGMCDKCWSAVVKNDDGTITLDDETASATCAQGGQHTFN